jgi:hypothetical protein
LIARNPSLNPIIRKESEENPIIRKFSKEKINPIIMKNLQVNPAIRNHQVQTLLSGSIRSPFNQEAPSSNPAIGKYQINPAIKNPTIRKHQVFKPRYQEVSGQPCN